LWKFRIKIPARKEAMRLAIRRFFVTMRDSASFIFAECNFDATPG